MSSNFSIKKVCEQCGNEFIARRLTTKYCSLKCNSKHYKILKRQEEITSYKKAVKVKKESKIPSIESVNKKDFLSVKDAAMLLNMSIRTVYRLIENKELNSYNFATRKTLIRRKDIDCYFELNLNNVHIDKKQLQDLITPDNSYSINEIIEKYKISNGALYNILNRLEIKKQNFGKHVLVKKVDIDKIFAS
jgi:excisionase family DNA binding protein